MAALVAVPLLVDPNQYKQQIAALVKEKTGRDVTVSGPIDVSVFPWVGVSLADVTLGDLDGFGAEPLAKVKRLEVRAKLMPLFSKRLEADKIAVDGLVLKLVRDAKGHANWEDLIGKKPAAPTTDVVKTPSVSTPATESGSGLAAFSLGGVEIRNSQVNWNDAVRGEKYAFKGLKVTSGVVVPGEPVAVELETDLEGMKQAANIHVVLAATAQVRPDNKSVQLQKTRLTLSMKGVHVIPVATAEMQLAADVDAALDGSTIKLAGVDLSFKTEGGSAALAKSASKLQGSVDLSPSRVNITGLTWTMQAEGKAGGSFSQLDAQYKGDIDGQREKLLFKLPKMDLVVKASGGTMPANGADLHLTATGELDLLKQTALLTSCKLEGLEQLKAEGVLNVTSFKDHPALSGELTFQPLNLRTLLTRLGQKPLSSADDKTLTNLKLKGAFKVDGQRLEVSRMEGKLDETTLQGSFSLPTKESLSATRFDLVADTLDLDRYLPPKGGEGGAKLVPVAGAGEKSAPDSAPSNEGEEIPVKLLRSLDLDGKLKLALLKAGGGQYQDVQLVAKGKDGVVRLESLSAKLFGGSVRGDATLDVRGDMPKLVMKQDFQEIKLESMLKELAQDESMAGLANLSMNLTSTGKRVAALKQGLNGQISFVIKNGAYLKMDIAHTIRQAYGAYAAAKGRTMEVGANTGRTPFTTMEGSAEIKNGIMESKTFQALSPALKLTGAGRADLPNNQLDFTTQVNLLTSLEDVNSKTINDLKGLTIPVKIYGNLQKPQTTVDLAGLLEQALKTKAMDKIQEKLGGKVQEKLGNLLQGKQGNGTDKPATEKPLDELKKILPFGR
ncbi:MAG: AsmA family protein [Magnetococcales bacterium]|nr:AsmA family protein [Magnetococcales bacterium]